MKHFYNKFYLLILTVIGVIPILNAQYILNGPIAGQGPLLNTESTSLSTGWVMVHDDIAHGGNSVNSWSDPIGIGFPFQFYGTMVDSFCVSKNFLLTFNTSLATTVVAPSIDTNSALPYSGLPDSTIAYLWCGFGDPAPLGSNDEVWTKTFGTAPNRQFWVKNFSYECEGQGFVYNFVVLEEGSNNIYVVDARNATVSSGTRTVGLQLNSTTSIQDPASPNITAINSNVTTPWPNVNYWEFTQPLALDVEMVSVDGPASGCALSSNETVTVSLTNPGTTTLTSIPVLYSLNGGAFVSAGTWTGSLPTDDTTTHTFSADLSAYQVHDLIVVANMTGDLNANNDTTMGAVESAAIYSISDTVLICIGDDYTFPDNTTQTNITTQVVYTSNLATQVYSCDSIITTVLEINPNVYDLTDAATVCKGSDYTFPDNSVETNITAQVVHVSNLSTDIFGCDSIITTTLDVQLIDSTVVHNGVNITANEAGARYQWINCDSSQAISGDTNQAFTATVNGNYAVEINVNGCLDTSECVSVTTVGINKLGQNSQVQVFPNPSTGLINVHLEKQFENVQIQVSDLQGKIVFDKSFNNSSELTIDLDNLKGSYLLQVQHDGGIEIHRIILN